MRNESGKSKGKLKSSSSSKTQLQTKSKSAGAKPRTLQSKSLPLPTQRSRTPLGVILLKRGMIKKFQIDFLVKLQKAYRLVDRQEMLGEMLVLHRALSPLQLKEALAIQNALPAESVTQVLSHIDEFSQKLTDFFKVKEMLQK